MADVPDPDTDPRAARSPGRLAKIAGLLTFALLSAGAMYLWVVRGEVMILDGVLAAFCL